MAFVNTLVSLYKNLNINDRLAKSLEKNSILTATSNTFSIDPNTSNMFIISASSNSNITIANLDSEYTTTGSVISILLTLSTGVVISWPNTIKWQNETAPTLSHKNLITLMHFGENNWYGGSIEIDNDYS